jgi:N-acetyl-alpha-D-glucosaminyl L-malate synthase BshA
VRPLKLAIACFPTVGGSGVVGSELAAGLADRGHEVHLFATGTPARLEAVAHGVVLHRVDPFVRPPLEHGAEPLALAAALATEGGAGGDLGGERRPFDLIHAHYAIPHAASAVLARQMLVRRGVPAPKLVTTLHGTDAGAIGADPALLPLTRYAVLESDLLTVPSKWLRQQATVALALPRTTPIEVVPNFVDSRPFHPLDAEARVAPLSRLFPGERHEGPARTRVLVHASNFRPLKRVGDCVEALAALRQQGARCVLLLVGSGPDRAQVEARAAALGVRAQVTLVDPVDQIADLGPLLGLGDLFLLPSDTESFGLAALEALACGVPVVASDVGGLPEVVRNGETGLLVPPRDPAALARAVAALLSDEPRRAAMAQAARLDATTRFRPEPMIARYEELYAGILE